MQISKIEVERFRGIRKLILTVPSKTQLIAGANNSGKSTIIDAINLFFSGIEKKLDMERVSPKNAYYNREGSRPLTTVILWFSNLNAQEKRDFASVLSPRRDGFWCQIKVQKLGDVSVSASNLSNAWEVYKKLISKYLVFHVPVLRVNRDGFSADENIRFNQTIEDVLIRNRPGPKSKYQKKHEKHFRTYSNLIGRVLAESRQAASNLLPSDSEIKFEFPDSRVVLRSILKNTHVQSRPKFGLTSQEEGTGYQSLLSLGLLKHIVSIEANRKNQEILILLEEPEAYLHPQYQRKVVKHIAELANQSQVFVSTHSPTIIDAAEIQNIMRIERDPSGLQYSWKPEELSEISRGKLSRYCDSKNSELIFSDRVIFCEGFSDATVIRKIIEQSSEFNEFSENLSVIAIGGRDNPEVFAELAMRFNIPFLFVFDKDIYSGDRAALKRLTKLLGAGLSKRDTKKFEKLKQQNCSTLDDANNLRRDANVSLIRRSIYTFASDIEGAIVTSYPKEKVTSELLKIGQIDDATKTSLDGKTGLAYYDELFRAIGSKGWAGRKVKNKAKPHIPGLFVEGLSTNFTQNSDLGKLKQVLRQFLRNTSNIRV